MPASIISDGMSFKAACSLLVLVPSESALTPHSYLRFRSVMQTGTVISFLIIGNKTLLINGMSLFFYNNSRSLITVLVRVYSISLLPAETLMINSTNKVR
jgi:hypothetical protein